MHYSHWKKKPLLLVIIHIQIFRILTKKILRDIHCFHRIFAFVVCLTESFLKISKLGCSINGKVLSIHLEQLDYRNYHGHIITITKNLFHVILYDMFSCIKWWQIALYAFRWYDLFIFFFGIFAIIKKTSLIIINVGKSF